MTQRTLHLAPHLSLPLDAVTQTIGILAKRRAGKSYLARRMAEQLLKARQQLVVVDPKGDWWGIRSAADGKTPGFPVTILGGERGDVPLEASAGEVVAKLAVEERADLLLDLSLFRKHEVATFMTGFLENLYRLKAREDFRTAMMLIVDEADAVAPQRPQKGEERMLGAAEDIVRRGGQRGIGCTLVTQRSAVLNKNVLTQCQVLVGLRTIAPQDLDALKEWIDVHGTTEGRKILMESLPSLPVGDAWIWSPGWPTDEGIFERVHVLPIETFDSGATPKPGEKRKEPKAPAEVDLEALRRQMAATLERAKADDPRELRRQIAQLKKDLAAKPAAAPAPARAPKTREVPVIKDAQLKRFEVLAGRITAEAERHVVRISAENEQHRKAIAVFWGSVNDVAQALLKSMQSIAHPAPVRPIFVRQPKEALRPTAPRRHPEKDPSLAEEPLARMGKGELVILRAVAQQSDAGATREQLTVLTGYKRSSRDTYLQRLSLAGLVVQSGERIVATDQGIASLGPDFEPLPTGDALRAHWMENLPEGEKKILGLLIELYPEPVERENISEATGYARSSRDTYIQRLSSRRLVEVAGRAAVRASEILFS